MASNQYFDKQNTSSGKFTFYKKLCQWIEVAHQPAECTGYWTRYHSAKCKWVSDSTQFSICHISIDIRGLSMLLGTEFEESYKSQHKNQPQYQLSVKNILNSLRHRHYSTKNVQFLRIHLFADDNIYVPFVLVTCRTRPPFKVSMDSSEFEN
jgi:hypothetical protein